MNYETKTELEAIASDVNGVISNLETGRRDASNRNNALDMYDGMEDEDNQKINHLQDALADATHDLDSAKDQLYLVVSYLEKLVEEDEIKQIMKKLI